MIQESIRSDYVDRLNTAQRQAVLHGDGPMLVVAGAGSGKTRVLTSRVAQLVQTHGVAPAEILAVTFTNKAAGEMRSRIADLLGTAPAGMWCGTFHSIGARLVRAHAPLVGRTASFTIYDEDDLLGVLKRIMDRLRIPVREYSPQVIAGAISDARNALVSPEEFERLARDSMAKATAQVFRQLEPAMRELNAVAFDDLLTLPVQILETNESVLAAYRRRIRHILVDEYQDTNRAQYRLVALLAGENGNVVVVGDDDQSIYGWRGADIRNILDFERDFPGAAVVRLEENYRSTPQILEVANAAISANVNRRGKTLRSTRPAGDAVTSVAALDERDEADHVVTDIQSRRFTVRGRPLRDFAVLYRTNAQSRALEEALRRHGVPYRLIGATRFYDRREIKDLMAYLKLIANPRDDEAFRRAVTAPRRGLGETSVDTLGDFARERGVSMLAAATSPDLLGTMRPAARAALADFAGVVERMRQRAQDAPVDELLRELIAAIRYEEHLRAEGPEAQDRLENVRELVASAAETVQDEGGEIGLTPLDHFLQRATLVSAVDALDPSADAVTLMTLHNAKGLEFPVVYLTGMEEGLFPLARARESAEQLEEERRLFYVGITRAEATLVFLHAKARRRNGEMLPSMASSFLRELPAELVQERATVRLRGSGRIFDRASAAQRRPGLAVNRISPTDYLDEEASQDAPRFVKGERIRHAKFGGGTIAELSGAGKQTKVTVDFDDESIGRKSLVVAYAGLERGID
jgi:DNA helicase-2/ATP-dependent DNA helicase PcrA